jgi:translation initiation factor IF-3
MDYGRYKYHLKKKQKDRGSGREQVVKEVRLRPKTDDHDRQIKIDRAKRFLADGSKVQFTMLFRGRERAHADIGFEMFQAIVADLGQDVKVERAPKLENRRMTMLVGPAKH